MHRISTQSLKLDGRWGTTDDIAAIHFHIPLSSAALRESLNTIPALYVASNSTYIKSVHNDMSKYGKHFVHGT